MILVIVLCSVVWVDSFLLSCNLNLPLLTLSLCGFPVVPPGPQTRICLHQFLHTREGKRKGHTYATREGRVWAVIHCSRTNDVLPSFAGSSGLRELSLAINSTAHCLWQSLKPCIQRRWRDTRMRYSSVTEHPFSPSVPKASQSSAHHTRLIPLSNFAHMSCSTSSVADCLPRSPALSSGLSWVPFWPVSKVERNTFSTTSLRSLSIWTCSFQHQTFFAHCQSMAPKRS